MKCEDQQRWRSPVPYCPSCIKKMPDVEVVVAHFQHCVGDDPMLQMAKLLPEHWDRIRFMNAVKEALMTGQIDADDFFDRHPKFDTRPDSGDWTD
jgi:hypothetical protein